MDPVSVAAITTLIFGTAVALSAFIRQVFISRDKELNERAHRRALERAFKGLSEQREQMLNKKRFTSHYHVMGDLADGVRFIDNQIEEVFRKKMALIQRYNSMVENESSSFVSKRPNTKRKSTCDLLRKEIDAQLEVYNSSLEELQRRRAAISVVHLETQQKLVENEQLRNESLDKLYHHHSDLLEKVYIRHTDGIDDCAKQTLDSGRQSYKDLFMMPVRFLKQFFSASDQINPHQMQNEIKSRQEVLQMETELNEQVHKSKHKHKHRHKQPGQTHLNDLNNGNVLGQ